MLLSIEVWCVGAYLNHPLSFAKVVSSKSPPQEYQHDCKVTALEFSLTKPTSLMSARESPELGTLSPLRDLRMKDVLFLTLSPAMYSGSVCGACSSSFASFPWLIYLLAAMLAGVLFSSQTYEIVRNTLWSDIIDKKDYVAVLAAHLFSATALPLLVATLWSHPSSYASSNLFLILSAVVQSIGSGAEILAHFRDGWVFGFGGHAEHGTENIIFTFGLVGAFALLAVSFSPSIKSIGMNALPLLLILPCIGRWEKSKKNVYAAQFLSSMSLAASIFQETRSPWPMLIFAQAFNIIRVTFRIKKTKIQKLHLCPSIYGWASYVLTFGLAQTYSNVSAPVAFAVTAMTIYLTDMLEKAIIKFNSDKQA